MSTEPEQPEQLEPEQPAEAKQTATIINTVLCSCGMRVSTANLLKHELSEEHIIYLYYNN